MLDLLVILILVLQPSKYDLPGGIEAGSEKNGYNNGMGTIADLNALGFNELSDGKTVETATVSGTALVLMNLRSMELVGESQRSSSLSAAAINEGTSDGGVTAKH